MSMRARRIRLVAVVVGLVVTTAAVAGSGGMSSSGVTIDTRDASARADLRELQRDVYERMNLRAEQLRRELSKAKPDDAVVAELEATLHALANEL